MKSLSASSSSRPTRRTPSAAARAGWMYGSYAISRVPNAAIRWANSTPMRPRPTTPTVLPAISTPVYLDRFHSPAFSAVDGAGGVPGDGEQQRDGLLGGGHDVRGRRVDDHDAARGGGRHLDVVEPDAGAGDHLQPRRGGDGLGVDLGGAAHDDRVGVGERGEQRRRGRFRRRGGRRSRRRAPRARRVRALRRSVRPGGQQERSSGPQVRREMDRTTCERRGFFRDRRPGLSERTEVRECAHRLPDSPL